MPKSFDKPKKRDSEKATRVKKAAKLCGVSPRAVYKVLNGDFDNDKVLTVYMTLQEEENKLLNEVKKLVMKIIDNRLYIEFTEMVECGVSSNYISKAKSDGVKCWKFIEDPEDRRKVLIDYEDLRDQYKEKVQKRFGSPYDYIAKQPIKKLIEKDFKAEEFYYAYRYDSDKFLAADYVHKYTLAASWLNMLIKVNADKKIIKKLLNLSIDQFFTHVCDIIKLTTLIFHLLTSASATK
jgi:predicted transcriptional regulator